MGGSGLNKKGFTLVEILVSSSLLVVMAISFSFLFQNNARLQKYSDKKLQDAYILQAKMEELRNMPFEKLKLQSGVIAIDSNLLKIQVGPIYTLRAR